MKRKDGRENNQLRPVTITTNFLKHSAGSVLIEVGDTKVICNASIEDKVPFFLKGTGKGWLTAEYSMLPSSTPTRSEREASKGKLSGRTHEIQRLIGRSLRTMIDLNAIGEQTIRIDCDVIQADGGTRTASITGACVAVAELFKNTSNLKRMPILCLVAATSAGIVQEEQLLDLNYYEDSQAGVDINLVMTSKNRIIEVQGTAEGSPFSFEELNGLLSISKDGISELFEFQRRVIGNGF